MVQGLWASSGGRLASCSPKCSGASCSSPCPRHIGSCNWCQPCSKRPSGLYSWSATATVIQQEHVKWTHEWNAWLLKLQWLCKCCLSSLLRLTDSVVDVMLALYTSFRWALAVHRESILHSCSATLCGWYSTYSSSNECKACHETMQADSVTNVTQCMTAPNGASQRRHFLSNKWLLMYQIAYTCSTSYNHCQKGTFCRSLLSLHMYR